MTTLKNRLIRYRRRLYEFFGSGRYSYAALNGIDRQLEKYLPYRGGFFIEAGANDGFTQSNTYYFEKIKGWTGILVEPIPEAYRKCIKERPNSVVFNCALVPEGYEDENVTMLYSGLMSLVKGAMKSETMDVEHAKRGMEVQQAVEKIYEISVPARTLTSIIEEVNVKEVDLLSLDIEGYELEALKGLDLEKYRPKYILVEARFRTDLEQYLSLYGYEVVDMLTRHDVLYRAR